LARVDAGASVDVTMLRPLIRSAHVALLALSLLIVGCGPSPYEPKPVAANDEIRGALQFSTTVRNALLDAIETDASTSAILRIRSGSVPATCATADAGTVLASMTLPSDWMAAASSGSKAKSGTWQDTSADNTGTAGHFRLYRSDGTTCAVQGTVTATGGGGDLTLDSTSITSGQTVTVTTFTFTAPGASLEIDVDGELVALYASSIEGAQRLGTAGAAIDWLAGIVAGPENFPTNDTRRGRLSPGGPIYSSQE
jgi:hypothetical protein